MRNARVLAAAVLSLLGLLAVLSACAGRNPAEGAPALSEVQFLDSGSFDRKLSASLSARQPLVTVVFPASITLNNIPERMDKWLAKVEKFGGKVEIQPEPEAGRGIISEIFGLFIKAYEAIEEAVIYAPAKNYNVMIYYRAQTGLVTRLCFVQKGSQAAGPQPVGPQPSVSQPVDAQPAGPQNPDAQAIPTGPAGGGFMPEGLPQAK
ncbi:MAG: hypothetical protein HY916_05440 [Desulfovibrio sp.]|jgi:hypothetical protein|nr:hypothetical protein [Desulfovibrio sp.]